MGKDFVKNAKIHMYSTSAVVMVEKLQMNSCPIHFPSPCHVRSND